VGNNKNPNQKQPGEKEPGTFHYNPGNMSGKGPSAKNKPQNRQPASDNQTQDKIENRRLGMFGRILSSIAPSETRMPRISKAQEFRAETCRRQAAQCSTVIEKSHWFVLADDWTKMAQF
jgi:hypothetical protein